MAFITEDFLLQSKTARRLYHTYAAEQPILDYHCHLSAKDIAENRQFRNLYEIWLEGITTSGAQCGPTEFQSATAPAMPTLTTSISHGHKLSRILCAIRCITGRIWNCRDTLASIRCSTRKLPARLGTSATNNLPIKI